MAVSVSQRLSDALYAPGVYSGRGGWLYRSLRGSQTRCTHAAARRFFVFETAKTFAIFGIASIAYDFQTGCQKKNRTRSRGFHPHPSSQVLFCISVRFHLCSKLEVNDVIKRKCADDARSTLLGAGMVCPIPSGRCAEPFWVRDFSGLGSCSPAIIFIAGEQALF